MSGNPDKKRCTAKSRTTGEQCKNYAIPGKKTCKYHGGTSGGIKGNQNGRKHGFFSKYFPDDPETQALINDIQAKTPTEILWESIVTQYTAIVRAQKIAFVRDINDKTREIVGTSSSDGEHGSSESTSFMVQEAWDKHLNLLNAQARAIRTLESTIARYEQLIRQDKADAEQDLRIEKLKLEIERLKNPADIDMSQYVNALKDTNQDLWEEEDHDNNNG